MRLKDKVAVITGAGRGLGRASALEMAREGASLVIMSRTASELRETARTIGKNAVHVTGDVSRPADIEKAVGRAVASFGRVDVLMNNAAVVGPLGPLHEVDRKEWDYAMSVNLTAVLIFSRAVVPHMLRQGSGRIINVTSGLGEMVMPAFGAYSIAKGGVIHLTRIMAEELGDLGIRVNGLDPGVMDTRMQEEVRALDPSALGEEVHARFVEMKEQGRLAPPERAARLAVFLASEESGPLTGMNGTESMYRDFGFQGGEP